MASWRGVALIPKLARAGLLEARLQVWGRLGQAIANCRNP